jgi:hypothetical protein
LAAALNAREVPWRLGGSAMIAALGADVVVGDLDVTVPAGTLDAVQAACEEWSPRTSVGNPPPPWCSSWLVAASIGDVEVEVIGDLCVVTPEGRRPVPQDLGGHLDLEGVTVPLADPAVWWWVYRGYKPDRASLLEAIVPATRRAAVERRLGPSPAPPGRAAPQPSDP